MSGLGSISVFNKTFNSGVDLLLNHSTGETDLFGDFTKWLYFYI